MKLIFLYVQDRRAPKYMESLPTEGYFWLLKNMVKDRTVDSAQIVIVSGTHAEFEFEEEGMSGVSVRTLRDVHSLLLPGAIIWCRGGWKAWYEALASWYGKYWLLMYAANTGRQKWPIWDVVFDDLERKQCLDGRGRFSLPWTKPTNPDLFYNMGVIDKRPWDICIGASHIHDRKGQWKVIDALIEHKRLTGRVIKCILPGAIRRGVQSNLIAEKIKQHGLAVDVVGMLPREKMCKVFNYSKLFLHMGGHGQNDRGPLEAMRCGCPVMIETPARHAPVVYECPDNAVTKVANDPVKLAVEIEARLSSDLDAARLRVSEYYEKVNGVDVCLAEMDQLFAFLRLHSKPDTKALAEYYERS